MRRDIPWFSFVQLWGNISSTELQCRKRRFFKSTLFHLQSSLWFSILQCLFSVIVFFNMSPHRSQGCQRTLLRIEMTEFIEISRCETRSNKFWKWSGIGNFSAPIQFMGVLDFQMGASLSQLKRKNLWWWFLFWKSFFVQCLFMRTFGGYLFVWGQFCVFLSSGSNTRQGGQVSKWWFSHTSTFKCPPVYFLIF